VTLSVPARRRTRGTDMRIHSWYNYMFIFCLFLVFSCWNWKLYFVNNV
jgi:hypothetical protein